MINNVPLSLYIHLPWCVKKCPYCDFNSHEIKTVLPEKSYIHALITDLRIQAHALQDREIISIFIGGGTPSVFSANNIKSLISSMQDYVTFAKDVEITIEANPGTFDQKNFAGFREAGVNRISIGAQSFTQQHLQSLGRIHNARTAIESIKIAKQAGFENINIDLMYALPQQTLCSASNDILQAIALNPTHISYYQLTIEPNTSFYRQPPHLPNTKLSWEIQQAGTELLTKYDYQQYEISAFSKQGHSCQHNINYWQFGDYLGIGAGAHQKLSIGLPHAITRSEKPKHPQQYINLMNDHQPKVHTYTLAKEDIIFEFMLNALRLKNGFNKSLFESHTGLTISDISEKIKTLVKEGLLIDKENSIHCSPKGYRFLNDVLQHWLPQTSAA